LFFYCIPRPYIVESANPTKGEKMATKAKTESRPMTEEADFLQIKSVDHVHFYVGNAKHAMYYWWKAFGFKPVAYSGLETGNRDFASYVLESGQARFVVSAAYSPSSPLASRRRSQGHRSRCGRC
jgi:4-hydroxyphenylpyruvate dioxygenase